MKTITDDVSRVLRTLEWDGNAAHITAGQLDRKVYLGVNDAMEACGGKWSRKDKAHVFVDNAAADALDLLVETGHFTPAKDKRQQFGEFFTPDALADELVAAVGMHDDTPSVLEPSAGNGQLIRAVERASNTAKVWAVEYQAKLYDVLEDGHPGHLVECVCDDFLSIPPEFWGVEFDYVIANPPFARQADIDHVLHAMKFLKDGGTLGAIMSRGWTFRENEKSKRFREFAQEHGDWWANPEGAFRESGTMVNTVMVVLKK